MRKNKVIALLLIVGVTMGTLTGCALNKLMKVDTPKPPTQQEEIEETSESEVVSEEVTSEETSEEETTSQEVSEENSSESSPENNAVVVDISSIQVTEENLPIFDGSTSLAPLGKALVADLLGKSVEEIGDTINFNRTTQSYRNLMNGACDIILASYPDETVFDDMTRNGFKCDIEEISTEALVFVVNKDNPVDNLTTQQIVDIYSGKITNWSEVGGNDEIIHAFQRNTGSGSQALMDKLVMRDVPMLEVPKEYLATEMGELMEAVKNYDNSSSAIGYSVYYYANDMKMAEGLKIISVDGVEPNPDTIRSKQYPHTNAYYCAIDAKKGGDTIERIIYNWLVGEEGQKLVASEGYVSILDTGVDSARDQIVINKYTRLQEEPIPYLQSGNYETIYPFIGEILYDAEYDGIDGYKYGFMDQNGCIIADPIYTDVEWNADHNIWIYECTLDAGSTGDDKWWNDGTFCRGFATKDGSYVTDHKYGYMKCLQEGVLLKKDYQAEQYVFIDYQGNLLFDDTKFPIGDDCDFRDIGVDGVIGYIHYSTRETYVINLNGDVLYGPFDQTFEAKNGLVPISDEEMDFYGALDFQGNVVLPIQYSYINIRDNVILAHNKEDKYCLFDFEGNLIDQAPIDFHYIFDSCGNYCRIKNDETAYDFYDINGNVVYSIDPAKERIVFDYIVSVEEENGLTMLNKLTGESQFFENANYVYVEAPYNYETDSWENPEYFYIECGKEGQSCLIDKHFNVIFEDEYCYYSVDKYTGEMYWKVDTRNLQGATRIYNVAGEMVKTTSANHFEFMNGGMMISDDYATKYYDKDGQMIFSYSLFRSLGE